MSKTFSFEPELDIDIDEVIENAVDDQIFDEVVDRFGYGYAMTGWNARNKIDITVDVVVEEKTTIIIKNITNKLNDIGKHTTESEVEQTIRKILSRMVEKGIYEDILDNICLFIHDDGIMDVEVKTVYPISKREDKYFVDDAIIHAIKGDIALFYGRDVDDKTVAKEAEYLTNRMDNEDKKYSVAISESNKIEDMYIHKCDGNLTFEIKYCGGDVIWMDEDEEKGKHAQGLFEEMNRTMHKLDLEEE